MNTVVIHQPDFLPYLGFFHRLLKADCYVVLDTVQFLRGSRSWHHRDRIKTPEGITWLTIPVQKAAQKTAISKMRISYEQPWQERHLRQLAHGYRKAPYYGQIMPVLERLYQQRPEYLAVFTLASIQLLAGLFDIDCPQIMASDLEVCGSGNELLANILSVVGATHYLSGIGAKTYFSPESYQQAGVEVVWQQFEHPVYPQLHGDFEAFLSSIDLLFNCGIDAARKILRGI
jgi:hypothetical protein